MSVAANFKGYGLDEVVVGSPSQGVPSVDSGKFVIYGFPFALWVSTLGIGDLTLQMVNIPPTTIEGFTLFSFDTAAPVGAGGLFGLMPDPLTFSIITVPVAPGNPFHWTYPAMPGFYPGSPLYVPPGALIGFLGLSMDSMAAAIDPATPLGFQVTSAVRVTF